MNKADIIYLEMGDVDTAISLWMAQLQFLCDQIDRGYSRKRVVVNRKAENSLNLSRLVRKSIEVGLKIFYACLANLKLEKLLAILNSFFASTNKTNLFSLFNLTPTCVFKTLEPPKPLPRVSISIIYMIKSLVRFMAIYLTDQAASISICSISSPRPMPSLVKYTNDLYNSSKLALVKDKLTNSISKSRSLANFMTVDKTLELFLCAGLFEEAIYFLNKMNDWKSSFLLNSILKQSSRLQKNWTLPEELSCETALIDKVITLLGIENSYMMEKDQIESINLILKELLVCSVLTKANILEPLLTKLIELLFINTEKLSDQSVLVPDGFYLPAPPIYCAQMYSEDSNDDDASINEAVMRMKLCSIVKAVLVVLISSNLHTPLVKWYLEQLNEASRQMNEKLGVSNMWQMRDSLAYLLKSLRYQKLGYISESVFALFRDFCALLFYIDLRDRFSLCLRQYKKHFIIFQNQGNFSTIFLEVKLRS
jgi:hypothetical protein